MITRICAVDPGPVESGLVLWDDGLPITPQVRKNEDIAHFFRTGQFNDCRKIAIEMIACYGMPVGKETFETCLWIGRFMEACYGREKPTVQLVFRRDVKIHLCGSMKAKDANIRQALIDKHGAPGTKKAPGKIYGISGHLWAALAVADYALTHE